MRKIMKLIASLLPALLILVACEQKMERRATGERQLRTTVPSQLYFKNLRSADYTVIAEQHPRLDVYRLKAFPDSSVQPLIVPLIVVNWLDDEAYLRFQTVPYPAGYERPLRLTYASPAGGLDTLVLESDDPARQRQLATQLREIIARRAYRSIVTKSGEFAPIFEREYGVNWLKTSLDDYFSLTDLEK